MNLHDPQSWIVLPLVGLALVYVCYQLAPKASLKAERALVLWLLQPGRLRPLALVGRRLAPRHRAGAATSCGGCGSGNSCHGKG